MILLEDQLFNYILLVFQFQMWSYDKSLENTVKRTIDLTKNLLLMQLKQLKTVLMDYDKTKVIVFDPRRGEFQVEVRKIWNISHIR